MNCPSCSHENPPEARFCNSCSFQLEACCPSCNQTNPPGSAFCNACGASLTQAPPQAPTPALTTTIPTSFASGRYQVRRFLGEGGKKRVFLAHDSRLDRDVAFSLIKTEGLDASGLARVRREAQAMGRLGDHPNVVTVHDIGEEAGQPYIVSQYMEGGSVEDLVEHAPDHRLPIDQTLQMASEVCQALRQAHDLPVVIEQPEVRRWYARMLIDRARSEHPEPARPEHSRRVEGRPSRSSGADLEKARQLLTEAIAMYRQIGMPKHVDMAETLLREV